MKNLLISAFILFILLSCEKPPELPLEPKISFRNIEYIDVEDPQARDTLALTIYFEDGDGNVGLDPEQIFPPYHQYEYITDEFGEPIKFGSQPGLPPYNLRDYAIEQVADNDKDTFYVKYNLDHFNIFVDFYTKQKGNYEKFDFLEELNVQGYNARIPFIDNEEERALQGEITYNMSSFAWDILFSIDTLNLRIQIQDRARHKSNIIETGDFTLIGIRE